MGTLGFEDIDVKSILLLNRGVYHTGQYLDIEPDLSTRTTHEIWINASELDSIERWRSGSTQWRKEVQLPGSGNSIEG